MRYNTVWGVFPSWCCGCCCVAFVFGFSCIRVVWDNYLQGLQKKSKTKARIWDSLRVRAEIRDWSLGVLWETECVLGNWEVQSLSFGRGLEKGIDHQFSRDQSGSVVPFLGSGCPNWYSVGVVFVGFVSVGIHFWQRDVSFGCETFSGI